MPGVFQLAAISDEIAQDFGRACEVAAAEFGLGWIELRELWGKNLFHLDRGELEEARRILARHRLRVICIASPLFKVDWPGAPRSRFSPARAAGPPFAAPAPAGRLASGLRRAAPEARPAGGASQMARDEFRAGFGFEQQEEVLERAIELALGLGAPRVRCFDFWRLEDAAPYRAAIQERLREAVAAMAVRGLELALENEFACNTATAAEAAETLEAVPGLQLVWDPANALRAGGAAFPEGYRRLPVGRIGHCHCKDAIAADGEWAWAPVGEGAVDWAGQLRALREDGYRGGISLETHWRGGLTPEAASRRCWRGLQAALGAAGALA